MLVSLYSLPEVEIPSWKIKYKLNNPFIEAIHSQPRIPTLSSITCPRYNLILEMHVYFLVSSPGALAKRLRTIRDVAGAGPEIRRRALEATPSTEWDYVI